MEDKVYIVPTEENSFGISDDYFVKEKSTQKILFCGNKDLVKEYITEHNLTIFMGEHYLE